MITVEDWERQHSVPFTKRTWQSRREGLGKQKTRVGWSEWVVGRSQEGRHWVLSDLQSDSRPCVAQSTDLWAEQAVKLLNHTNHQCIGGQFYNLGFWFSGILDFEPNEPTVHRSDIWIIYFSVSRWSDFYLFTFLLPISSLDLSPPHQTVIKQSSNPLQITIKFRFLLSLF
jgi:hypothetical protein